jgi:hypothetical protein
LHERSFHGANYTAALLLRRRPNPYVVSSTSNLGRNALCFDLCGVSLGLISVANYFLICIANNQILAIKST